MKSVMPILKKTMQRNGAHSQAKIFAVGSQDEVDLLSYSGLDEQVDHLLIDGTYVRTLFISGYPFVAHTGWLDHIVNFNHDADLSYHLQPIEPRYALPKLNRKITELESTKRAMMRDGKIIGSELTDPLESAISLRNKILRGQEKLFQVAIYISLRARTLQELERISRLMETTLAGHLFYSKIARYRQLEALQSVLPRAEDRLAQKRNMDSSSAALSFPFVSSELVQETGILYGVNKSNNSLVILDRFGLQNANSIMFAQSGSGKSYATKVEVLRQLMQGTKVVIIDPEREYMSLAESVHGTHIVLSAQSTHKINPFDMASTQRDRKDIIAQVQDLIGIVSLMVDGLSAREKAALDKSILKIYGRPKKKQPLLEDLFSELHALGQLDMCERMEKYISGSLAQVFNAQTNIDLSNRLVVFDIKDLSESLRPLMMLIVSNFVQNQVKAKPEKRLLVIDEAWMLLEDEVSARFVAGMVRRARKYYLGVMIISQQANDFLGNEYGRAIASQSALRIFMRQDSTTIANVVSEFNLSEYESHYLLTCQRGEALIVADQNHAAVSIVASDEEHPLITTNPNEIYE